MFMQKLKKVTFEIKETSLIQFPYAYALQYI